MLQLKGKILYTATSDIHLAAFHYPYIKWLDEQGYEVHLAMEKRADLEFSHARQIHYMPFPRTPLDRRNVSTYRQLKNLIDKEQYDLIHCHTPMPGVLTRLAARARRKKGAAVLYTAHGFHFFKGAPLKYWLSYFPAEYALSFITDAIITINSEDFTYADKRLHPRKAFMIPGIGIDSGKFRVYSEEEKKAVRLKYGFKQQQFLLLYIAEFIPRKNHRFILENLPALIRQVPTVQVIFAGRGELMDQMLNLARNLRVEDHVRFMGFMHDLGPLAAIADVGISASRQEGLGLGLAEQMLCGVPVVATEDRGHKELVIHEQTGLMFPQGDQIAFLEALVRFSKEPSLRQKMGNAARLHAEKFRIEASLDSMRNIYNGYLKPDQKTD